jgi:hypothetical protein
VIETPLFSKLGLGEADAQQLAQIAKPRCKAAGDLRQTRLLLPVSGRKEDATPAPTAATVQPRRRKA